MEDPRGRHQNGGGNGGGILGSSIGEVETERRAAKMLLPPSGGGLGDNVQITVDDEATSQKSEVELETGSESVFERDESLPMISPKDEENEKSDAMECDDRRAHPGEHSESQPFGLPPVFEMGDKKNLKLSVGASDSEEETDEDRAKLLREWHQQQRPRKEDSTLNDFDLEVDPTLMVDQISSILKGDTAFFNPIPSDNFVEEVYATKLPKIIKKYLFGEVIGKGSYARVKEVVEIDTLTRRAIKIIKEQRIRKIPNGTENVMREIQILRKVVHPNVIKLIEVFSDSQRGKMYVVMEFCIGNLQQTIEGQADKHLTESDAHNYFKQLIFGLVYLHSLGIIHKDIKPGNLLLSSDFTLKISDFGVAEELPPFQGNDFCQIVNGTPKFQAPELVSGNSEFYYGFKADVWACGVTLYNMISGLYPFEGEVIMRLFDNIANSPLKMPTNVKVEKYLEELLQGMMEKDPLRRWSTDQIQHSQWFRHKLKKDQSYYTSIACLNAEPRCPTTVQPALVELFGADPSQSQSQAASNEAIAKSVFSDASMRPIVSDDAMIVNFTAADGGPSRSSKVLLPPGFSETTAPPSASAANSFHQARPLPDNIPGSAPFTQTPPTDAFLSQPPVPRRNRSFLNCFRSNTAP